MCHFWYSIFYGLLGFYLKMLLMSLKIFIKFFGLEYMITNKILYQCPAIYRIQNTTIHEMRKRKFLFLKSCYVS